MKNLSTEHQTTDSLQTQTQNDTTSHTPELLCPQCQEKVPLIENISISSKKAPLITLKCQCLHPKKEEGIELNDYMNFLAAQNKRHLCFKHFDQIGSIFCKNCSLYMCNICYSYHVAFGPSHETQFVSTKADNKACSNHSNQTLDFYCEDCNENVCIECSKNAHYTHCVMQLREYWEKTKQKISISSSTELKALISKQLNSFNSLIQNQLGKIHSIIFALQQIKTKLEQGARKVTEENTKIGSFANLLFCHFFKTQATPNFAIIQNIEKIQIEEILTKKEENEILGIYDQISDCLDSLQKSGSGLFVKTIVKISKKAPKPINAVNIPNNPMPIKIYLQPIIQPQKAIQTITEEKQPSKFKQPPYLEREKENEKIQPPTRCWFNDDGNTTKRNTFNTTDCSTQSIREDCNKIVKKEDILKTLDIFSNDDEFPSNNYTYQTNSSNQNQYINKKTKRPGTKREQKGEEKSSVKETNKNRKSQKNVTHQNEDTIIKVPLTILEQNQLLTNDPLEEDRTSKIEQKNNEEQKQVTQFDPFQTQENKDIFALNCVLPSNPPSVDHMPLIAQESSKRDSSPVLLFNYEYDSLTNIFGNDNQSKLNFDMSGNLSRRGSQEINLDNDEDFFNKIFSKPKDHSKTSTPNDNTKRFEYKMPANKFEQCTITIGEHKSPINVLSQLSNGLLVSGGKDNVINFFNGNNGYECVSKITANKNEIISLLELLDKNIAVGFIDNTIKIYELSNKKCITILIGHSKPVISIAQKDCNTIISSSEDHSLKIWDLKTKVCLMTFDEHFEGVTGVVILNDTIFVSASNDCTIKIWNFSQTKSLHTIKAHRASITKIIKLDDNQVASASYDKTIKIWDIIQKKCLGTLIGHTDKVSSIVHLMDGSIASASFDCSIKIWNLNNMSCQKTIISSSLKVNHIIQLSDSSIVTSADDNLIKIWV